MIDLEQDYKDARALEQRDRARKGRADLREALSSIPIAGAEPKDSTELVLVDPAGRPIAGESVADKLSILMAWLIEDSDLPAGEVDDFVAAINAALEWAPAAEAAAELEG